MHRFVTVDLDCSWSGVPKWFARGYWRVPNVSPESYIETAGLLIRRAMQDFAEQQLRGSHGLVVIMAETHVWHYNALAAKLIDNAVGALAVASPARFFLRRPVWEDLQRRFNRGT
jgi:hypothetical protein